MATNLKSSQLPQGLSESDIAQLRVLKTLADANPKGDPSQTMEILAIAEGAGMGKDKDSCQRCLYILEGQRLVSPFPAGDLTSPNWHVTIRGLEAVNKFDI